MQSEYGVPETQQLMMDGCSSSLDTSQNQRHHIQYHLHQLHHQQQQQQQQPQQQRYLYFPQPMPITQPFFHQHHNSLQAFQQQEQQRQLHQQLGLDPESAPEPFIVSNFKLGVDENSANRGQAALNDTDDEVLRGRREEDSVIKEPFWKPLDIEYINKNNKRCKEKMETSFEFNKKGEKGTENEEGKSSSSNYGLFGELEAIYTISGGIGGNGGNQTGSGSGLTGDNPAATAAAIGPHSGNPRGGDHASETSTGEEVPLKKLQKSSKKKKKRKQLGVIATFFESLVRQLMEHQDSLHMKFLEVMEKREKERTDREEAWRKQEAAKSERAAISRAQERALASSREATIVAFLEKIAGESVNLPTETHHSQFPSQIQDENLNDESHKLTSNGNNNNNKVSSNADNNNYIVDGMNINIARRWPKAEVQALIRVRSGFECKFQEPGLKGPLWELVSSSMASMGYERSAKRCKEKWENINKYFRKTKDCAKKRSQQSKTCPYFHQLDQLYSKSFNTPEKPSHSVTTAATEAKGNSELLDAVVVVVPTDNDDSLNPPLKFSQQQINMSRGGFNFSQMGPLGLDFNGNGSDNPEEGDGNGEEDEEEDDDDVDGEDQDENQDHVQDLGY